MPLSASYCCSFNNHCLSLLEQMGKFYELFEMDAHVGVKELDLQYMKVSNGSRTFSTFACNLYDHIVRLTLNYLLSGLNSFT